MNGSDIDVAVAELRQEWGLVPLADRQRKKPVWLALCCGLPPVQVELDSRETYLGRVRGWSVRRMRQIVDVNGSRYATPAEEVAFLALTDGD